MYLPASIKAPLRRLLGRFLPLREPLERVDFQPHELAVIRAVRPYTMTTGERVVGLTRAVEYLVKSGIAGAITECGVYKGGSMMAVALTLVRLGDTSRPLYLYDTFEGMVRPGAQDLDYGGRPALEDFLQHQIDEDRSSWAAAGLDAVRAAMSSTGYPSAQIHYVRGKVEETLPGTTPDRIALLRLDTDWYESTRHELEHLFPKLVPGGVLIIDDYGHYQGCQQAVDEYLANLEQPMLLTRMDYSGRLGVKR
jgi:hypothetical protein